MRALFINDRGEPRVQHAVRGLRVALREPSVQCAMLMGALLICLRRRVVPFVLIAIAVELINTAVEKTCNRISTDWCPEIRDIKDLTAGASMLAQVAVAWVALTTTPKEATT